MIDRKPVALQDIRYFEASSVPLILAGHGRYVGEIYKLCKNTIALGQRLGRKGGELGLSLGGESHLYIAFTHDLPQAEVRELAYKEAYFQKYVACGLDRQVNDLAPSEQYALVRLLTFTTLNTTVPALMPILAALDREEAAHGVHTRIERVAKQTKNYRVVVTYTVAPVASLAKTPAKSQLWIEVIDRSSGLSREAVLTDLEFYLDADYLADKIVIDGQVIRVEPRKSFTSQLTVARYPQPLQVSIPRLFGSSENQETLSIGARQTP
jgi:hypothetical protein